MLLAAVLAATPAAAQVPGDCQLGLAGADLDVGDVRATVFNTGSLFFAEDQWSAYEVPRGSGRSPWFAAGLWVAAHVEGELRMAGSTYDSFVIPWTQILPMIVVTIGVALLMTWIPARQASRIAPAEALRYE